MEKGQNPGGKVRKITLKHAEFCALFHMNCARFLTRYRPEHAKNRAFTPHQPARIGEIADAEAIHTLNVLIKPYTLFRVIRHDLAVYSLAIC